MVLWLKALPFVHRAMLCNEDFVGKLSLKYAVIGALGLCVASPFASAQDSAEPASADVVSPQSVTSGEDEIVVSSQQLLNTQLSDVPPNLSFDEQDIQGFGASTIGELLEALELETRSGRAGGNEPAIILINGRRVSSRREVQAYPTEAVLRMDVLPEAAALRFGYRADQRVINFVLVENFQSVTAEAEAKVPTAGGFRDLELEASRFRVHTNGRSSLDIKYKNGSSLLESERDIEVAGGGAPYALLGNITAETRGDEIDPALSAALGETISVIGVPLGADQNGLSFAQLVAGGAGVNETDVSPFRTLRSAKESVSLNGAYTQNFKNGMQGTFSAGTDYSLSQSLRGLPKVVLAVPEESVFNPAAFPIDVYRYVDALGPQTRDQKSLKTKAAFSLLSASVVNSWSLTGSYEVSSSETETRSVLLTDGFQALLDAKDVTANPFGPVATDGFERNRSLAEVKTGKLEFVTNRQLFDLPAGIVTTTVKLGATSRSQDSKTVKAETLKETPLARGERRLQVSLDAPVFNVPDKAFPGSLKVNGNFAIENASDFGTLETLGAGLRWRPVDNLRLSMSLKEEENAPSVAQLGNPVVTTSNDRIYDYATGDTVFATRIAGGNPDLKAVTRDVFAVGARLEPLGTRELTVSVDYLEEETKNPVRSFPSPTAEIEAAFPDRFERGALGQLTMINATPIGFDHESNRQISTVLSFRKRLGETGAGEGSRTTKSHLGPRSNQRAGRGKKPALKMVSFSLRHDWRLEDSLTIDDTLPVIDYLAGSALSGGGVRRVHDMTARASFFSNGYGARLSANWKSRATLKGPVSLASGDLNYGAFGKADLRFFADLNSQKDIQDAYPWLKDARVSLSVENIFDARQSVTDSSGATPLNFQRGLIDPAGRTVSLSMRKRF